MEDRAKSFFFLLMATFLLGILIHLVIPIEIVVNATQKIQQVYNGYKIEVEQNTVRGIAYLNSLAISNQIQIYENVRSFVIRLFQTGTRYQVTQFARINMINAYVLANSDLSAIGSDYQEHTMWFIPNVTSYNDMNGLQKWIIEQFSQIAEYMSSIQINNQFHQGLQAIQITINYEGQQLYFQYPAAVDQRFTKVDANILGEDYRKTVLNFKTSNRYQTLIMSEDNFKACSSILDNNQPFAVVCLKLDIHAVMNKISNVLKVPDFDLSTSRYYLLKPLYKYEDMRYPQIIANFTSENLNQIQFPQNQSFQQLTQNLQQLFGSQDNYLLNVKQLQKFKTYYVTPIETYNNIDTKQIILYFVVVNDFAKSQLKNANHERKFFVIMIVPSTILLLISALAMGFSMKPIFAKLRYYSSLLTQYCAFILKNDMNLEVVEQGETSDFVQIFKNLKCLNLLNKLTAMKYMRVSQNQRIIKLLRALELFDQLGYSSDSNKMNIYENLAYCYQRTGDLQNSIKYLQLSITTTINELNGIQYIQQFQKQRSQQQNQQKLQIKSSIRHLRYKIYKLCILHYNAYTTGDILTTQQLSKNVQLLQKLLSANSVSVQFVYCYMLWTICCIENGTSKFQIEERIQNIGNWIRKIQNSQYRRNKLMPIEILRSYHYYLKGKYLLKQQQYLQAYQAYIIALDGHKFDPQLHRSIKRQIQVILEICSIASPQIQQIFGYLSQENMEKAAREFIFVSDVSNPGMGIQQFNEWKLQARKMAQHIFNNHIGPKDRVGISEFCNDTKVICNLIQKSSNQSMLKKQLMSSIKAKHETVYSHLIPNLRKVIERTKNLKKQKVFIIFLKQGIEVETTDILQEIEKIQNSIFIFVVKQMSERINCAQEGFYIIDFDSFQFIDIVLGTKSIKKADNIVYIF